MQTEIDGVFSGGGMKGFALIGAIEAAEAHGYLFKRVAGASAGAIAAAFLAAGYTGAEMHQLLIEAPRRKFMDARFHAFPFLKWLALYWSMGLYKGDALEKWLAEKLALRGVVSFNDIAPGTLKIIVSDVSNNQLIVLPDDLPKYQLDPEQFSVAKAVRMSASIPFIFRPVKLKEDLIVDGGLLSNFPMWLFSGKDTPKERPVLGIRLTPKEKAVEKRQIKNSLEMFSALFNTMLTAHDLRYISRKIEDDIIFISLKEGISADFDLSRKECKELIRTGRRTAETFFQSWKHEM